MVVRTVLTVAALVCGLLVTTGAPASAHCVIVGGGNAFDGQCSYDHDHEGDGDGEGEGGGSTSDPNSRGPIYDVVETTHEGVTCWMIAEVGPGGMTWSRAIWWLNQWTGNGVGHDACDFGGSPAGPETSWYEQLCPPPAPTPVTVQPDGRAVTGMETYLTIGGSRFEDIPCVGHVIRAEARYVIHWGDGTTTETTSQGGPYPDGDVRHTYTETGDVTITVEAYWRGTVGSIVLGELPIPTTATTAVTIDEVQAVRSR